MKQFPHLILLIVMVLVIAGLSLDHAGCESEAACNNLCRERQTHYFCGGAPETAPCVDFVYASCSLCNPALPNVACVDTGAPILTNCLPASDTGALYYKYCDEDCPCGTTLFAVEASNLRTYSHQLTIARRTCQP